MIKKQVKANAVAFLTRAYDHSIADNDLSLFSSPKNTEIPAELHISCREAMAGEWESPVRKPLYGLVFFRPGCRVTDSGKSSTAS